MSNRRMMSGEQEDTQAFNGMSSSAQSLYHKIVLHADDEGFRDDVPTDMFQSHAGQEDLKSLLSLGWILETKDPKVVLVKHWFEIQELKTDRFRRSKYRELESGFFVKDDGSYTLEPSKGIPMVEWLDRRYPKTKSETIRRQSVSTLDTQCSVVESSVVESKEVNTITSHSSVVVDSSKEGNEWDGLNSHEIIESFVRKGWIRDDEEVRSLYLSLIQSMIGKPGFYESLSQVCPALFGNDAASKCESSLLYARLKDALLTMIGGIR